MRANRWSGRAVSGRESSLFAPIGQRRVAEIDREAIHGLLTVVLSEEEISTVVIINVRTCLSALMQMAWDRVYRSDNPVKGIKLKHPPRGGTVVATPKQCDRAYKALPDGPPKVFARLGVSTGARYCELISLMPEDFDFETNMLTVRRSTVEVTAEFHPDGYRFLAREYTKNGEHRRMKIDKQVSKNGPGVHPGERDRARRADLPDAAVCLPRRHGPPHPDEQGRDRGPGGWTEPLLYGKRCRPGTMGAYTTAKCRCDGCRQWSADYGRALSRYGCCGYRLTQIGRLCSGLSTLA